MGDGEEGEFEPGGDAGFVEDIGEVAFDRLLADGELLCDVAVAASFNDAGDDLDGETSQEDDDLFDDAVRLVFEFGKASTSLLQRRLRIGYGRAAHLIDMMERDGLVGPAEMCIRDSL